LAHHQGHAETEHRAAKALQDLADATDLHRTAAYLTHHGLGPVPNKTDRPPIASIRPGPAEILAKGLLGLLAEAADRTPGRRLHLFDALLVVERHGDITLLPAPSARMLDVLDAL